MPGQRHQSQPAAVQPTQLPTQRRQKFQSESCVTGTPAGMVQSCSSSWAPAASHASGASFPALGVAHAAGPTLLGVLFCAACMSGGQAVNLLRADWGEAAQGRTAVCTACWCTKRADQGSPHGRQLRAAPRCLLVAAVQKPPPPPGLLARHRLHRQHHLLQGLPVLVWPQWCQLAAGGCGLTQRAACMPSPPLWCM